MRGGFNRKNDHRRAIFDLRFLVRPFDHTGMSYRPRRCKYSPSRWQLERDRFNIDAEAPTQIADQPVETLREPIHKLLKSLGLEQPTLQHQLMERWATITGQPLCRHIRPGPIHQGQLTVYVSNSPMLTELSRFQGPALLKNIQAALGPAAIKKLRFVIDPDTRRP